MWGSKAELKQKERELRREAGANNLESHGGQWKLHILQKHHDFSSPEVICCSETVLGSHPLILTRYTRAHQRGMTGSYVCD